jgi:hypothetical protein
VILILFMDLIVDAAVNGGTPSYGACIETILAFPVITYGLSSVLTVAVFFVMETWNGFPFLHTVGNLDEILVDWVMMVMMLGAPILAMICSLFARLENWWSISLYTWFSSVSIFYCVFSLVVVYYEIQAAWLIVRQLNDKSRMSVFFFLLDCVQRKQYSFWCGRQDKGLTSPIDNNELEPSDSLVARWYTSLTLAKWCGCLFETIDPPERMYSVEEILGRRRFVSRYNWSMEQVFRSNLRNESIAVIRGPAALKRSQIVSSLICVSVFITGVFLLVIGFLVWVRESALTMILSVLLVICCCFPRFRASVRYMKVYRQIEDWDGVGPEERRAEDCAYQSFETYRVSRPKRALRLFSFCLSVGFLYVWPVAILITIGGWVVAHRVKISSLPHTSHYDTVANGNLQVTIHSLEFSW